METKVAHPLVESLQSPGKWPVHAAAQLLAYILAAVHNTVQFSSEVLNVVAQFRLIVPMSGRHHPLVWSRGIAFRQMSL